MNRIALFNIRNVLMNVAIIFTILIGIESILIGYNHQLDIFIDIGDYCGFISSETLEFHRGLSVIIGFGLIFISHRLFKRMRIAWVIAICMIVNLTIMYILKSGSIFKPATVIQMVIITVLIVNYQEFKKASDPISLRNGIRLSLIVITIIMINTCFNIYIFKNKVLPGDGVYGAIYNTLKMLFLIDTSVLGDAPKMEIALAKLGILINWVGIITVLIFILKPLVYQQMVNGFDREKVRKLLKLYGDNPISYVSIEDDKKYYFGKNIEGVMAYVVEAGVAVCAGDPVCSDEDMPLIITEFINYCKQNDLEICFCHTLEKHIQLYTKFGFNNIKCGEEAMFDLEIYNLTGGKAAKIRNAINHATALGITVEEYKILEYKDRQIEEQMKDISRQWLNNKKSSELSFMLGTISFDKPMDRRYFAAYDQEGKMLGFIVFSPFAGGQGYLADVTRRKKNAPIGVMEKITIEAFRKMKLEGIKWGSLGLAPLANITDDGKVTGKLLEFTYEKLNNFYGFKSLHHYKKKYGCTVWESRYIVYYSRTFTPKIAYSIIKAHNPKGISDFILIQLKSIFLKKSLM
jgi:phosphatidylglycerol lysyltransferase